MWQKDWSHTGWNLYKNCGPSHILHPFHHCNRDGQQKHRCKSYIVQHYVSHATQKHLSLFFFVNYKNMGVLYTFFSLISSGFIPLLLFIYFSFILKKCVGVGETLSSLVWATPVSDFGNWQILLVWDLLENCRYIFKNCC